MNVPVSLLCLALAGVACGPPAPPQPPPAPNGDPGAPPSQGANPWTVSGELEREALPADAPTLPFAAAKLPPAHPGLPSPPARCSDFADRAVPAAACDDRSQTLTSLDAALAESDTKKRDAALQALRDCPELPAGMTTALRAELAPVECGDVIVRKTVDTPPEGMSGVMYDALYGLGLAGMLSRASTAPPEVKPPFTRADVLAFVKDKMQAWSIRHAEALQDLSKRGSQLKYYGQAVVAVEAGLADIRYVEAMRSVPLPEEFANDEELKETYLTALETSLDPRKQRGRDAALVGLGRLATIGVIRDERVRRARELLSKMFGGSRIDALDVLLLPPLSPAPPASVEERLASRLQTFYAGLLFDAAVVDNEKIFRQLIENGVSLPHRIALKDKPLSGTMRLLYARARFELGQNYWRSVDFAESTRLLLEWEGARPEEARLLLALGIAMRSGPKDAADMMQRAPIHQLGIGNVAALDSMASEGGPLKGHAGFDAALLAMLAAPAEADADYWRAVAKRFRDAAAIIVDLPTKRDAESRAAEADQIAEAIAKRP